MPFQSRDYRERFWDKVDTHNFNSELCWEWTGLLHSGGYGRLRVNGRYLMAHRVAYELIVGPIPEGLTVDHLCRNRLCVNPAHMKPVTRQENLDRGIHPNTAKTHCPQGHEYTPENTYTHSGKRSCIICQKKRSHEQWLAQVELANAK